MKRIVVSPSVASGAGLPGLALALL